MSPPRCRFCDHNNPDSARFCNACGSPLHLKPCPQCEAVNDTAAERCYECGAALETAALSHPLAGEMPIAETVEKGDPPRHIPESVGARLDTLIQGHPAYAEVEADRRDAFVRSSRRSGAMFFAVILLVLGGLGYYGYEYKGEQDANVGQVAATVADDNRPTAAERPETVTPHAAEPSAANAATSAPGGGAETPSEATQSIPEVKAAEAAEPVAAQTTARAPVDAAPKDAAAPKNTRQSTNVKAAPRQRPSIATPANKPDPEHYSRPAAPSDASAQATQRMIERYLGTRAGVSSQRSVQ